MTIYIILDVDGNVPPSMQSLTLTSRLHLATLLKQPENTESSMISTR
jgi:hypothetical protein